jgi:hypothetical protein
LWLNSDQTAVKQFDIAKQKRFALKLVKIGVGFVGSVYLIEFFSKLLSVRIAIIATYILPILKYNKFINGQYATTTDISGLLPCPRAEQQSAALSPTMFCHSATQHC